MRKKVNNATANVKTKRILAFVITIVLAVALAITGILCFGVNKGRNIDNEVGSGERSATTYDAITKFGKTINLDTQTKNGTIRNGDIINMKFCATLNAKPSGVHAYWKNRQNGYVANSGMYTLTLPAGKYTFELWGAQGGNSRTGIPTSRSNGGMVLSQAYVAYGGMGAYAKGTLTLSAQTTVYIQVGGQGTSSLDNPYNVIRGGGYNGGGGVINDGNGGGGGGSTDVRIASNTVNNRILVAGGGGGASWGASNPGGYAGGTGSGEVGYFTQSVVNGSNTLWWVPSGSTVGGGGTQTHGGYWIYPWTGGVTNHDNINNEARNTTITHSGSTATGGTGASIATTATEGVFGAGGNGAGSHWAGGGGGSGWYGGAGGYVHTGGGGSSFARTASTPAASMPASYAYRSVNTYNLTDTALVAGNDARLKSGGTLANPGGTGWGSAGRICKNMGANATTAVAYPTTHAGYGWGDEGGDGFARLTVVEINKDPVATKDPTNASTANAYDYSAAARGVLGTAERITVIPSEIAKDPENTQVYFSNGSSTNYDTVTAYNPTTSTGFKFYLNADGSKDASDYISWSLENASKAYITEIKKYPRNGTYSVKNGQLRLYAPIRDSYGDSTGKGRGYALVPFYVDVGDGKLTYQKVEAPPTNATPINDTKGKYLQYSYGTGDNAYNYRVGTSNITNPDADFIFNGGVYNTTTGVPTVFIPQTLTPSRSQGFTLYVNDIFTDPDKNYDLVGIRSYAIATGTGINATEQAANAQYYSVTISPNTTTYGSAGLADQIVIKPTALRPQTSTFVYLTITAQSYEKDAQIKAVIPNTTTENNAEFKINLIFKISNTRPVFGEKGDFSNEAHIEVEVGKTETLNITSFLKDPDGTTPRFITAQEIVGTDTYDFIKLPENEYISVTRENTFITVPETKFISNYGSNKTGITASDVNRTAGALSKDTGEAAGKATGFKDYKYIMSSANAPTDTSWFTYSYAPDGSSISITGKAASQYIYADKNSNYQNRLGDFYILVRVYDAGDVGDYGIWYPIAITVKSSTPTETTPSSGFTLSFHGYNDGKDIDGTVVADASTVDKEEDSIYLTPISYTDASGEIQPVGHTNQGNVLSDAPDTYPFLVDADVFSYGSASGNDAAKAWTYKLNEIVTLNLFYGSNGELDSTKTTEQQLERIINADVARYGTDYDISKFFKIELQTLYAGSKVFGNMLPAQLNRLGVTQVTTDIYRFYGLKLTPLRSTNNYFYEFGVNVVDSHGTVNEGVHVYAKVESRSINLRRDGEQTTQYPLNTSIWQGKYVSNGTGVISKYVSYTIEKGKTLVLTPYDFAYDFDTIDNGGDSADYKLSRKKDGVSTFNTNPDNAGYDGEKGTYAQITKEYNVFRTFTLADAANATKVRVPLEQLTFTNMSSFGASMTAYSSYLKSDVSYNSISGWNVPASGGIQTIEITGESRTQKALLTLTFSVTDGFSVVTCSISVAVENAAPVVSKDTEEKLFEEGGVFKFSTTADPAKGLYTERWFTVGELASDIDNDTVRFVTGSVRIVVLDDTRTELEKNKRYFDTLYVDSTGKYSSITPSKEDLDAGKYEVIKLSDYLSAVLTLNGDGANAIRVNALSSTQIIPFTVYLEFECRDGSIGDEKRATLHVPVEVYNVNPTVITDELTKVNDSYYWMVKNEIAAEKTLPRYIVNCEELYNSSAIVATSANKMLLFNDNDAQQYVLLNPVAYKTGNDNKYSALVQHSNSAITESNASTLFGNNAAVLYTQTYEDSWLDINLICFQKNKDGSFTRITETSDPAIIDCKYWALEIIDKNSGEANDTQIAIKFKDNHYNVNNYAFESTTDGSGKTVFERKAKTNSTSCDMIVSLYYQYQSAGITIMHDYYRTNGNIESQSLLHGTGTSANSTDDDYTVDYDRVYDYQFESGSKPTDEPDATLGANNGQEKLGKVSFTSEFTYQYFVLGSKNWGEDEASTITPKLYPSSGGNNNAFYYEPIDIGANSSGAATYMPLSYIAMLQNVSVKNTENEDGTTTLGGTSLSTTHVAFPNERNNSDPKDTDLSTNYKNWGVGVNYSNYKNWSTSSDIYKLFTNVSITDGSKTWYGNVKPSDDNYIMNNDYVDIQYTVSESDLNSSKYMNTLRGDVSSEYQFLPLTAAEKASFYEDTLGFSFKKKAGSPRVTSMLRFSVNLKTSKPESATQSAWVDLYMDNSKPSITNLTGPDSSRQPPKTLQSTLTYNLFMTTGDINGKQVRFLNSTNPQISSLTADNTKVNIVYSDADANDEVVFLVPSSTDGKLGSSLSTTEIDSIVTGAPITTDSYKDYFNLDDISQEYETGGRKKADYIPNPDYKKFFEIEPADGSSSTITIVPKAKTALNIPTGDAANEAQYYAKNKLLKDGWGVYYPFRILFYDRVEDKTGLENGFYGSIIIKVYITNNAISFNRSAVGAQKDNTRENVFNLSLTKNSPYSVDVSSFLIDNDMALNGMSFSVATDESYKNLDASANSDEKKLVEKNQQLVKDYLQMPAMSDTENVTTSNNFKDKAVSELPVKAELDSSSPTSILFTAEGAFKASSTTPIRLKFVFKDSVGSTVTVIFAISYINESPSANKDTYGSANTLNIYMKTGDYFNLYAFDYASSNNFALDDKGGFSSPDNISSSYPNKTASTLRTAFTATTDTGYETNYGNKKNSDLGSLILGDDDAPSTLRFTANNGETTRAVGSFAEKDGIDDWNNFEVRAIDSLSMKAESEEVYYPVGITVKATGVTSNAIYTVPLYDSHTKKETNVTLNITVLSTPPTVRDVRLGKAADLAKVGTDKFNLNLNYDESFEFELADLMTDPDGKDIDGLYIPDAFGGSQFDITNGGGVSSVSVEQTTKESVNSLKIKAIDFIPEYGECAEVKFKVSDPHGTYSNEITICVYVEAREPKAEKTYNLTLRSREEYVSDGNADKLHIVATKGNVITDADADAPSAMYTVNVYALLEKSGDDFVQATGPVTDSSSDNYNLLISRTQSAGGQSAKTQEGSGDIFDYVSMFFGIEISDDGKTLTFTPRTSTTSTIPLHITVQKKYKTETGATLMSAKIGLVNVKVTNSRPVAVENNDKNIGYPRLNGNIRTGQAFRSFRGTAGQQLTWDIYNKANEDLGLFVDYDMSGDKGTTEVLSFVSSDYASQYKGTNPVLDVTSKDGQVTIKINHKVYPNQPDAEGAEESSTRIVVTLTVRDNHGATGTTTIEVFVENDVPKFKEVTEPENKGYTVTDMGGGNFVMYATIPSGDKVRVYIRDIIDDADKNIDQYVLCTPQSSGALMPTTKEIFSAGGAKLFDFRVELGNTNSTNGTSEGITTTNFIEFTGVSTARGTQATCLLQIRDTVKTGKTGIMTVILTVGNNAPVPKENISITVMGVKYGEKVTKAVLTDNIVNYVTDVNPGDAVDATKEGNTSNSYIWIDGLTMPDDMSDVDPPVIFGKGYEASKTEEGTSDGDDMMGGSTRISTVCQVAIAEFEKCQMFEVTLYPGVYGTQKVIFNVIDSGYLDGNRPDGIPVNVELTITVVRPVDDMDLPKFSIANKVTRLVTPELLLNTETEKHNADGYSIANIEAAGVLSASSKASANSSAYGAVNTSASGDDWYLTANAEDPNARMTVTFDIGSGKTITQEFEVVVTPNQQPILKDYDGLGIFSVDQLDMNNMIRISPEDWFDDPDIGDVMRFVTPLKVKISAYAEANLDPSNNQIILTFKGRGTTDLTLTLTDASGVLYTYTVKIGCNDMPELNFFNSMVAKIQSNPILFWIIFGIILLLILLLIIILVVIHKKRKMRAEIEALLNSEAELEEEMLRLSSGGAMQYHSYGYLPPTSQTIHDPGLMIGSSANNPVPNTLQLGAGSGQTVGVSPQQSAPQQPMGGYPDTAPKTQVIPSDPTVPPQQVQPMQQQQQFRQQQPMQQQQPQFGQPMQQQYGQPQQPFAQPQQQPYQQQPQQQFGQPMQQPFAQPQQQPYQQPQPQQQFGQPMQQQQQSPANPPIDDFDPDSF